MPSTVADLRAQGRAARDALARSAHASVPLASDRDAERVLAGQHATRLQDLVAVRVGRMLQSPFALFRGSAAQMAADLAHGPSTTQHVVACGDAHLSNFGLYASPERALLFDLNDFDEGGVAPWEWDVKRLAASVHVAGRDAGLTEEQSREAVLRTTAGYRDALAEMTSLTAIERYFLRVDADDVEALVDDEASRRLTRKIARKARRRTADRVLARITTRDAEGAPRMLDEPPITRHVDHVTRDELDALFASYRSTLREDARLLLSQFTVVDVVLRVVGVGSVGTRCYVLLLTGPGGEPLFLQAKEAGRSVLVSHGGMAEADTAYPAAGVRSEGHRVVCAQRVLQAQSDPFLGWIEGWAGDLPGRPRVDYYWRQFRDMKGSVELDDLSSSQLGRYGALCARMLARAHAQSPQAHAASAYLGRSDRMPEALADWARAYADVTEADHATLEAAVAAGRLPVERDA